MNKSDKFMESLMIFIAVAAIAVMCTLVATAGRKVTAMTKYEDIAALFPGAKVVGYNHHTRELFLNIEEPLTNGSDGACVMFSSMVHKMVDLDHKLSIHVSGSWIPSLKNPIDYQQALYLDSDIPSSDETQEDFYRHHRSE